MAVQRGEGLNPVVSAPQLIKWRNDMELVYRTIMVLVATGIVYMIHHHGGSLLVFIAIGVAYLIITQTSKQEE